MIDKAKEWMKANMGKFAITEGVENNWFSIHTSNMEKLLAAYESSRVQELEEALQSCLLCLGVLEICAGAAAKEMIGRCLEKNGKVYLAERALAGKKEGNK